MSGEVVPPQLRRLEGRTEEQAYDDLRSEIAEDLANHVVRQLFGLGLALSSLQSRSGEPSVRDGLAQVVGDLDALVVELRTLVFAAQAPAPERPTSVMREGPP